MNSTLLSFYVLHLIDTIQPVFNSSCTKKSSGILFSRYPPQAVSKQLSTPVCPNIEGNSGFGTTPEPRQGILQLPEGLYPLLRQALPQPSPPAAFLSVRTTSSITSSGVDAPAVTPTCCRPCSQTGLIS